MNEHNFGIINVPDRRYLRAIGLVDLQEIGTDNIVTAYSAREREWLHEENGISGTILCTEFLIYRNDRWLWVDAKFYKPVE